MGLRDELKSRATAAGERVQQAGSDVLDTAQRRGGDALGSALEAGGKAAGKVGVGDGDKLELRDVLMQLVRKARERTEQRKPTSRKDVKRSYKWRLRFAGAIGWFGPPGLAADAATGLYTEAGVLLDVAALHGQVRPDEEFAALLLVLWGMVADLEGAQRALAGDLGGVGDHLSERAQALRELRGVRGKAKLLRLLWKVRSGDVEDAPGLRDLDAMIDAAERTLGVGDRGTSIG